MKRLTTVLLEDAQVLKVSAGLLGCLENSDVEKLMNKKVDIMAADSD